jgi:probable rRNA maturation factor
MYRITVQRAVKKKSIPSTAQFKLWATCVLQKKVSSGEVTIRIVNEDEITHLNSTYRKKNYATNVLSFPMDISDEFNEKIPELGDIVICAEVIAKEAVEQHKKEEAHWAHMVVHGTLHLLGFDHEKDQDAEIMEAEEVSILKSLGFENPYGIASQQHER